MHAEHRFITGPTARPLMVLPNTLPDLNQTPLLVGNRKASASPATTATSSRSGLRPPARVAPATSVLNSR